MAKLSARGRTELLRLEKRDGNVRFQYAFMSDGKTLKKLTFYGEQGESHHTGWHVIKLKIDSEEAKKRLLTNGFTATK